MKQIVKCGVLLLFAGLVLFLHQRERKNKQLSWCAYGKLLLGLDPVNPGPNSVNPEQKPNSGRIRYLDNLRLLAVLLVILVHSARRAAELILFMSSYNTWRMIQENVLLAASALGLCCNLLFVMISGALLLKNKKEPPLAFYLRRVEKVTIPLAIYYLFYLRMSGRLSCSAPDLFAAAKQILSGPMELLPHFWLMYTLLGLYVAVPFLRPMVGSMSEGKKRGLLAVILIGSGTKLAAGLAGITLGVSSFLLEWEGVFLLGYLLAANGIANAANYKSETGISPSEGKRSETGISPSEGKKFEADICLGEENQLEANQYSGTGSEPPVEQHSDRSWWLLVLLGGLSAAVLLLTAILAPQLSTLTGGNSVLMMLVSAAIFLLFQRREAVKNSKRKPIATAFRQIISKYGFSILMIHWFFLFVIVEDRWGFSALRFGTDLILPAVLVQSLVTLVLSLLFSIALDQTVVFLFQRAWRGVTWLLAGEKRKK